MKKDIYVIKIDDGFVEIGYGLTGSDEYSIQDLINVITDNTKLTATRTSHNQLKKQFD